MGVYKNQVSVLVLISFLSSNLCFAMDSTRTSFSRVQTRTSFVTASTSTATNPAPTAVTIAPSPLKQSSENTWVVPVVVGAAVCGVVFTCYLFGKAKKSFCKKRATQPLDLPLYGTDEEDIGIPARAKDWPWTNFEPAIALQEVVR